jgi:hypothetical protein
LPLPVDAAPLPAGNDGPFSHFHKQSQWPAAQGIHLYEKDRFAEAVASFTAALEQNPQDPKIYYDRQPPTRWWIASRHCATGADFWS